MKNLDKTLKDWMCVRQKGDVLNDLSGLTWGKMHGNKTYVVHITTKNNNKEKRIRKTKTKHE